MPYTRIDRKVQNDARFRRLTDDAKFVFFMLLTHPNLTSVGVLRSSPEAIAIEIGWAQKRYLKAFRGSVSEGLVEHFPEDLWITFPHWLRYNGPNNPNVLKSWVYAWDTLPECEQKCVLWQRLKAFADSVSKAFQEAFRKAFGGSVPDSVAVAVAVEGTENDISDSSNPLVRSANPKRKRVRVAVSKEIEVGQVIAHYQTHHPKAKPGEPEKGKIRARLREGHSVEDLCAAIDGMHKNPHNLGDNDRGKAFLGLAVALKNSDQVSRFAEENRNGNPESAHDPDIMERAKARIEARRPK